MCVCSARKQKTDEHSISSLGVFFYLFIFESVNNVEKVVICDIGIRLLFANAGFFSY